MLEALPYRATPTPLRPSLLCPPRLHVSSRPVVAGNTPLHLACDRGLVGKARLLLEWGADVNCLNEAGAVPAEVMKYRTDVTAWL